MVANRGRDTAPELALRREVHRRGLRYRVDVRPDPSVRRKADLVFVGAKVAVFVDGCFWHSCPDHGEIPASNRAWWRQKLAITARRDAETDRLLREAGWRVMRCWEHEPAANAADRVQALVRGR
jgi:DNA mismatch endonuclease (patch repair protein)